MLLLLPLFLFSFVLNSYSLNPDVDYTEFKDEEDQDDWYMINDEDLENIPEPEIDVNQVKHPGKKDIFNYDEKYRKSYNIDDLRYQEALRKIEKSPNDVKGLTEVRYIRYKEGNEHKTKGQKYIHRPYYVHYPKHFLDATAEERKEYAIFLQFHGMGNTCGNFHRRMNLRELSENPLLNKKFIIISPCGTIGKLSKPTWNAGICCNHRDDIDYIFDVIFEVVGLYDIHIAENQAFPEMYALGWSNGGFLTEAFSCMGTFHMAASVSGNLALTMGFVQQFNSRMKQIAKERGVHPDTFTVKIDDLPHKPTPIDLCNAVYRNNHRPISRYFHIHGTKDWTVPMHASKILIRGLPSVMADVSGWEKRMVEREAIDIKLRGGDTPRYYQRTCGTGKVQLTGGRQKLAGWFERIWNGGYKLNLKRCQFNFFNKRSNELIQGGPALPELSTAFTTFDSGHVILREEGYSTAADILTFFGFVQEGQKLKGAIGNYGNLFEDKDSAVKWSIGSDSIQVPTV